MQCTACSTTATHTHAGLAQVHPTILLNSYALTFVRSKGFQRNFSASSKVMTWMYSVQDGCGGTGKERARMNRSHTDEKGREHARMNHALTHTHTNKHAHTHNTHTQTHTHTHTLTKFLVAKALYRSLML